MAALLLILWIDERKEDIVTDSSLGQDEKVLSNRTPRRQNLDKKIGVIRQKKTSQQQVQPSWKSETEK